MTQTVKPELLESDPWAAVEAGASTKRRPLGKRARLGAAAAAAAVLLAAGATAGLSAASLNDARGKAAQALGELEQACQPRQEAAPVLVQIIRTDPPLEQALMDPVIRAFNKAAVNDPGTDGADPKFAAYADAQNSLDTTLTTLLAKAATHPGLKAKQDYQETVRKLSDASPQIAEKMTAYDDAATAYNEARHSFPANLLAPMLGHGTDWGTVTP